MKSTSSPSIRSQLVVFSLARLVINTGFRMTYPFLPTLARGVGVDLSTIGSAALAGLIYLGPRVASRRESACRDGVSGDFASSRPGN